MPETLKKLRSLKETDVTHRRVLLRTSLNVPIAQDGSVGDLYRLKRGLPTLRHLAGKGAQIIIVGYIGRTGGTLRPVSEALKVLAPDIPIRFTETPLSAVVDEIEELQPGECLMLENIRREAGEEKNDPELSKLLASLADVFVDDAFAEAHRLYASNVGVTSFVSSCAGLLMEEEVTRLCEALRPPHNSLAIIGGAKFETKQPLIEKLLTIFPKLLLGGALANDVLKARGLPVGSSLVSDFPVPTLIAGDERIHIPLDLVVEGADGSRPSHTADVRSDEHIVDIGVATEREWVKAIEEAEFVLWNGPMGIYEKGYVHGTHVLAAALVRSNARAVVGGGDTDAAIAQASFDPDRIFMSTGGGAMLEFLANSGSLPAVDVLMN